MKQRISMFFFLGLMGLYLVTNSQNADTATSFRVTELDPVSLTASLAPMATSKTGRNIVVIKGERLANLPVHSIDELLRYVPGVEVQTRGSMGSQSDIVLRGGTFQQVLIVLDGIRLNDPNTGHFNSYIPIAPAEIDRIEILKGASSAIYGSEAVGGVISITTKTFTGVYGGKRKAFSTQVATGEYGFWGVNAGGIFQKDKTSIGGGVLTNNANGQLQRGTRGFLNNTMTSVSFNHFFNEKLKIFLRVAYDNRKFSAQNFYTTFLSDTASEKVESFWNQLKISYKKGRNQFSFNAGFKDVIDQYAFSSSLPPNKNKSKLFQAITVYEYQITNKSLLITGSQFQQKSIRSNDRGNHDAKQVAGFAILNQTIGKNFLMAPALRLEWSERSGTELVPQINLSYKIDSWQIRGSAGTTTREADFTERYNNYNKAFVANGSIGNPSLEAERSFSYEAGTDYFFSSWLKISAGVFRREQKKVIDWTTTPYSEMPRKNNLSATGNYALAKNIANVNTSGFEMDIQFDEEIGNEQSIWVTAGLVWLDSETNDTRPSFYISSHSKLLTNFNVIYKWRWFAASATGVYKRRSPQSAAGINAKLSREYFVMNTKVDAFVWKRKLSVFVEVDNLFDTKYADLLGSQMPGCWWMGGVKVNVY